jgi:hypothetical protein
MIPPLGPAPAGTQAGLPAWIGRLRFPHAAWIPAFAGSGVHE